MFMSDVSIIVRKMRTQAERNQATLGIGFPEQLVLMHLKAYGSTNQDTIATSLDIDKGAVAKTVAKLEDKGLVSRQVNPKNKREKLVIMEEGAHKVLEAMMDSYQQMEQTMFAGLAPEQIASMSEAISRVAQNVSEL